MVVPTTAVRRGSAISGLLLVLFLIVHLGGLIPSVTAPESFEIYASRLHHSAWLPLLEIGLLATVLIHLSLTVLKSVANLQAGNTAQLSSRRRDGIGSIAARWKAIAGIISLGFLVVHLQQLRWMRPGDGLERETLTHLLNNPAVLALYIAGSIAIGLHLLHGNEAAHRSIGALSPANGPWIRSNGRWLAVLMSAGFVLISLSLALGDAA